MTVQDRFHLGEVSHRPGNGCQYLVVVVVVKREEVE